VADAATVLEITVKYKYLN